MPSDLVLAPKFTPLRFFHAMDTYREHKQSNDLWTSGEAPWKDRVLTPPESDHSAQLALLQRNLTKAEATAPSNIESRPRQASQ